MGKITRYIDQLINRIIPNGPAQTRARHQVSLPCSSTALPGPSPPLSTRPGSLIPTYSRSLINHARCWTGKKSTNWHRCTSFTFLPNNGWLTRYDVGLVDLLPDDVLLAIFDFCADLEAWQTLVHVCRRWRIVVLESPRRLNLQLVCSAKTPARKTLDIWPALPLVILNDIDHPIENMDNIVAVLERSNRVRQIDLLGVSSLHLASGLAAMQEPFPELTHLMLSSNEETVPVFPDSFLGGSAPRLRIVYFGGIPFPGLPKLLLSATHLVYLSLFDIPHSGYFSPEAMVTVLSMLISLESLSLEFRSPRSRPDLRSQRPPPPTRFVLPVLTDFEFKGVSEYSDDLMARIDAPQLIKLYITFFNQIVFDTPQFVQFISRTPRLKAPQKARVTFEGDAASINLSSHTSGFQWLYVRIPCRELDWQVSSLEQVCTLCLPPLFMLEDLYISEYQYSLPDWQDNIENTLWLELLLPFRSVKNLYLSEEFARRIVPALEELVEDRRTEVLPTLENIFLEGLAASGPVEKSVGQFVAMREVTGHPMAVTRWDRISS
jgi:hypothetical protein